MSVEEVKFAQVKEPLFLHGKNFGQKLYSKDLHMKYSTTEKELYAYYKGEVAVIPLSSVACLVPADSKDYIEALFSEKKAELKKEVAAKPNRPVATHVSHPKVADIGKAQVGDPTRGIK